MSDADLEALASARGKSSLNPLPHPTEQQPTLTAEPDVVRHAAVQLGPDQELRPSPAAEPERQRGLSPGGQGDRRGHGSGAARQGLAFDPTLVGPDQPGFAAADSGCHEVDVGALRSESLDRSEVPVRASRRSTRSRSSTRTTRCGTPTVPKASHSRRPRPRGRRKPARDLDIGQPDLGLVAGAVAARPDDSSVGEKAKVAGLGQLQINRQPRAAQRRVAAHGGPGPVGVPVRHPDPARGVRRQDHQPVGPYTGAAVADRRHPGGRPALRRT